LTAFNDRFVDFDASFQINFLFNLTMSKLSQSFEESKLFRGTSLLPNKIYRF